MAADVRLEDILLAEDLPVLPWVDIAAEVVFAPDASRAQGAWVDAFVTRPGAVVLAVGDVSGAGGSPPVVAAQLRAAMRERLIAGASLEEVLVALDGFAGHLSEGNTCSVCLVEMTSGASMSYGSAGHPLPLVVSDGRAHRLDSPGAPPLGSGGPFAVRSVRLDDGDVILMCHNGAFSGQPQEWRRGVDTWRHAVADGRGSHDASTVREAARLCRAGVDAIGGATGYQDQLVTLAAHRIAPAEPLRLVRMVDAEAPDRVRGQLSTWLGTAGVGVVDRIAALRAVEELIRNVVVHAYPAGVAGRLSVDAHLAEDGFLQVCVGDQGAWTRPDPVATSGHGLGIAAVLADHFTVRPESGTVAEWHRRLGRPIGLRQAHVVGPPPHQAAFEVTLTRRADRIVLEVAGALDDDAAEALLSQFMHLSNGGVIPATLDVTGVTRWSGAGVQILLRLTGLTGRPQSNGRVALVDLVAAPDSVAQQVLDILHIPHRVIGPT